jgi:hypothetical protein
MANEFDDIRPYEESEINDAMKRIVSNPYFENVINFLYPGIPAEKVKDNFRSIKNIFTFQMNVMYFALQNILKNSSAGLTYSGIENLDRSKRYLFLSNHRDIFLDSAILQIILLANKHETTCISAGDNLMTSDFLIDIGKSNKMFKLIRGGTPRNIFINSLHTSKYIRYALNERHQSIWIAQRNGRTKDGNDQTQHAVLKMFGMSGGRDFAQNFSELNITPIVISYEYDPGDSLKTREIYISRRKTYVKAKGEDFNSILSGIRQFKGKIHLSITPTVREDDLRKIENGHKNEQIQNLATLIDTRVYDNFRLWNTNYIAHDMLYGSGFASRYSAEEKVAFTENMNMALSRIEGDKQELENIFFSIYANPLVNFIKSTGLHQQPGINNLKHFECS